MGASECNCQRADDDGFRDRNCCINSPYNPDDIVYNADRFGRVRIVSETVEGIEDEGEDIKMRNQGLGGATVSNSTKATTSHRMEATGREEEGQLRFFEQELEELAKLQDDVVASNANPGARFHMCHTFKSGATYCGQWLNGMRHGYGKMCWLEGARYEGQWIENVATGRGRFRHGDGDQYVGEWCKNMANGMGVYYHDGYQTYLGEWHEDYQHGYGIESWYRGDWYEGEFVRSRKEGFGRFRWGGGCEYVGRWADNQICGYGICSAPDGRIFEGAWKDTALHGMGRCTFADGTECSGMYSSDKPAGFGVFREADGSILRGFWSKEVPVKCMCTDKTTCDHSRGATHVTSFQAM